MMVARGPIDLRLVYDLHGIDLGRVEVGQRPLTVIGGGDGERVSGVTFNYGPGMLPLDEALVRARALKRQLEGAGFGLLPGAEQAGDPPPFTAMPSNGNEGVHAADWADAAHMLGDEAREITAMDLYTLRTQGHVASVRLENERRHERDVCPHSEWSGEGGREWRLLVTISPSLAPTQE
jgi:hypothetical protein